jgi:DHA1 family tetracycline resistance protein-like MFS transporter
MGLFSVQVLNTIAHYSLPSVFVLYAGYRYGWTVATVGWTLAFVGICTAVVQAGVVGPAVRWLGERRAVLWGLLCSTAAYAVYGLAPSGTWFLVGVPLGALAGIYGGAAQSLMTQQVSAQDQGMLQGANSSVMGLVGLLGPGVFTYCFAQAIAQPPMFSGHLPGAPFLLAAVLTLVSFLVALRVAQPSAQGRE